MHRVPGTNLVFIHIPKTAGQALKVAFQIPNQASGSHNVNTAVDRTLLGLEYIRFCVVRHPFARFVSSFKYNIAEGIRRPNKKGSLAAAMRAKGLDRDVNVFVDWLFETRYDMNRFAHLRPQSYYLDMGQPQIVMRHETIATDCEIVKRLAPEAWHGMPIKNASADKLGLDGLITALTPQSKLQLARLYADDFKRLGYNPNASQIVARKDQKRESASSANLAAPTGVSCVV